VNDVDKFGVVSADPLWPIRAVEPRLGRIEGGYPAEAAQAGSLNGPPDVGRHVGAEAVADEVNLFGIRSRFPD
jgi:hypothetical protein